MQLEIHVFEKTHHLVLDWRRVVIVDLLELEKSSSLKISAVIVLAKVDHILAGVSTAMKRFLLHRRSEYLHLFLV